MNRYGSMRGRQRGITLVIGLIMLVMISLAAVASYHLSKTSTEVVGNMQFQNEAVASADSVIQEALSTLRMFETPNSVLANPCGGTANTRCFDYNGDGTNDVRVVLATPSCVMVRPRLNSDLDLEIDDETHQPRDVGCATEAMLSGVEGASSSASLCSGTIWEISATATDLLTNAYITVTQGAEVQIKTTDAELSCT